MTTARRPLLASICAASLVTLLSACSGTPELPTATGTVQPRECGSMTRLHEAEGIYLGSQPSPADLRQFKTDGIRTVLNLRKPTEIDWDESALANELGVDYVALGFSSPTELTDDIFDESRVLMSDTAKRPLLVHCKSSNRVGALWLAHRVLDDGIALEAAVAEATVVGLKSPALLDKAKSYIERNTPKE